MTYGEVITTWTLVKRFTVPGQPIAKGRPRMAKRGRFVKVYTPKKTLLYERSVGMMAPGPMLAAGVPILVEARMIFSRPQRLMRRKDPDGLIPHTVKPDGDNVMKTILDGLNGVAFADDAQAFGGSWRKYYAEKATPDKARVEISIYVYNPQQQQPTEDEMT